MDDLVGKFRGCARVELGNLWCNSFRLPSPDNVERLCKIFSAGCQRLDPDNFIIALIDQVVLEAVLAAQALTYRDLSYEDPPLLRFPPSTRLECLHGASRLQAAQQSQDVHEKWWVVKMYDAAITPQGRTALTERPNLTLSYSDGDKFRYYRMYKLRGDSEGANRWYLQLSKEKAKLVSRIESTSIIRALDMNLPIRGLFDGLEIGAFNRILRMRCEPEISAALSKVHVLWDAILTTELAPADVDVQTVRMLRLLCPQDCVEDEETVETLFSENSIFTSIKDQAFRARLKRRVLDCSRIITVSTVIQDTNWLSACHQSLQTIFPSPVRLKQGFRWELLQCFSHKEGFLPSYIELWVFAMREYPRLCNISPLRGRGGAKIHIEKQVSDCVEELAFTACALGFRNSKIASILAGCDTTPKINAPPDDDPETSCNDVSISARLRSNRPDRTGTERYKKYFFLEVLSRSMDQPKRRYVTWFRIVQHIAYCFWPELDGLTETSHMKRFDEAKALLTHSDGNISLSSSSEETPGTVGILTSGISRPRLVSSVYPSENRVANFDSDQPSQGDVEDVLMDDLVNSYLDVLPQTRSAGTTHLEKQSAKLHQQRKRENRKQSVVGARAVPLKQRLSRPALPRMLRKRQTRASDIQRWLDDRAAETVPHDESRAAEEQAVADTALADDRAARTPSNPKDNRQTRMSGLEHYTH